MFTYPVLLAHGLEGSPAGRKAATLRAAGVQLTCPDARGLTLAERIQQVEPIAASLGPMILVGSSYGGLVALWLAQRFPSQIRGLVLCAPALQRIEAPLFDALSCQQHYADTSSMASTTTSSLFITANPSPRGTLTSPLSSSTMTTACGLPYPISLLPFYAINPIRYPRSIRSTKRSVSENGKYLDKNKRSPTRCPIGYRSFEASLSSKPTIFTATSSARPRAAQHCVHIGLKALPQHSVRAIFLAKILGNFLITSKKYPSYTKRALPARRAHQMGVTRGATLQTFPQEQTLRQHRPLSPEMRRAR